MTIRAITLNYCIGLLAYIPAVTYLLIVGIVIQKIKQIISIDTYLWLALMEKNQ